nr:unnamed protein product [Callosobruchus chinensis]
MNATPKQKTWKSIGVKVPPQIVPFDFGNKPAHSGEFVQVYCTVNEGDLPLIIKWYLNGHHLDNFLDITVAPAGRRASILSIESVSYEHVGNVTCVAKNRAGVARYSAELQVNVQPQIAPFDFGSKPVHSGEFIQVICTVNEGDLPLTIKWYLNGNAIDNHLDISVAPAGRRGSILSIESVTYEHVVPPQIAPFDFETVNSGDTVTVTCTAARGDLPIGMKWIFENRTIEGAANNSVTVSRTSKRVSQLSIDPVTDKNAGTYTCAAKNRAGVARYSATLHVNVPPQIAPFEFETVNSGDAVSVACTATRGDLPIGMKWIFNGRTIEGSGNSSVAVSRTGKRMTHLSIDSVTYQNAGTYTCAARNKVGVARYSAPLHVNVPPRITPFYFEGNPLNSGEYAQVNCLVAMGDLPLTIDWHLNGLRLDNYAEISVMKGKRSSMLTIESVSYSTAVPPRIVPFSFGDQVVNAGQATQATCLVSEGDLPLKITWSFDGNAADASFTTIKISPKASLLLIDSASEIQAGNYSCTVTNAAGSVSFTASLDVYGTLWILFGD